MRYLRPIKINKTADPDGFTSPLDSGDHREKKCHTRETEDSLTPSAVQPDLIVAPVHFMERDVEKETETKIALELS